MTEKRFNMEYVLGDRAIWHITDCGEHIADEKICDLLNQLNDENERLRKQNEELIKSMQETARLSAKAITKSMVEERWGKGVDYD